jgi:hypothetical protein
MADQSDRNCAVPARQAMTRKPYKSSQYDISLPGRRPRWFPDCRQTGSYPETGFEEINGDLREADFWPE